MLLNKNLCNLFLTLALVLTRGYFTNSMPLSNSDFKVINQSGNEIVNLYIAEYESNNWEKDLLKKDILKNQQERTFYLPIYHRCDYIIRAIFYNTDEIRKRINLCENNNVTIKSQTIETNYKIQ